MRTTPTLDDGLLNEARKLESPPPPDRNTELPVFQRRKSSRRVALDAVLRAEDKDGSRRAAIVRRITREGTVVG